MPSLYVSSVVRAHREEGSQGGSAMLKQLGKGSSSKELAARSEGPDGTDGPDGPEKGQADGKLVTYLPSGAEQLFSAEVEKPMKGQTDTWIPRVAVLCRDKICFTRPNSRLVNETIWLQDLWRVETLGHWGTQADTEDPDSEHHLELSQLKQTINAQNSILVFVLRDYSKQGFTKILMRCKHQEERDEFVAQVRKAQNMVLTDDPLMAQFWRMRRVYDSNRYQSFMYFVIALGYFLSVFEAQTQPEPGGASATALYSLELLITITFTLDLGFHYVAAVDPYQLLVSTQKFLYDAWVLFDLFIVLVSWISHFSASVPGLSGLRLFRVFRVVKVLKSWPSLRNMIAAISGSVNHMMYNFFVVIMISSIFAVISTNMFRDRSEIYFGKWSTSMYTMMQLATGHDWPVVSRATWEDPDQFDPWAGWFFLCYVLAVTTVLMNVVVAALLDEYLASRAREKEDAANQILEDFIRDTPELTGSLDPLMLALSFFATPSDLDKHLDEIFEVCDPDNTGRVDYEMMVDGLKTLNLGKGFSFSFEDWHLFTDQGRCLEENGGLSLQSFHCQLRKELKQYSFRMLSQEQNDTNKKRASSLLTLKLLLSEEKRVTKSGNGPEMLTMPFTPRNHRTRSSETSKSATNGSGDSFHEAPSPTSYSSHGVILSTKTPAAKMRATVSRKGTTHLTPEQNLPEDADSSQLAVDTAAPASTQQTSAAQSLNGAASASQSDGHSFSATASSPSPQLETTLARGLAQINARLSALDTNYASLHTKIIAVDFRINRFEHQMEQMTNTLVRKLDRFTEMTSQVVQSENELLSNVLASRTSEPSETVPENPEA